MSRGFAISKKQYWTFGTESLTEYLFKVHVHVHVVHHLSFHNKISDALIWLKTDIPIFYHRYLPILITDPIFYI